MLKWHFSPFLYLAIKLKIGKEVAIKKIGEEILPLIVGIGFMKLGGKNIAGISVSNSANEWAAKLPMHTKMILFYL